MLILWFDVYLLVGHNNRRGDDYDHKETTQATSQKTYTA